MKYELVLQFDASNSEDFDQLIAVEDRLESALGNLHEVDGHDFGSGEMNIFIHTNDPDSAFDLVKNNMDDSIITKLKVAYRKLDREEYHVIWPENFQGEFKVI